MPIAKVAAIPAVSSRARSLPSYRWFRRRSSSWLSKPDRSDARPHRAADAARHRRRGDRMSAPGKLVRSSRWKTGPSKGQRPPGSECCVVTGDGGCEAYTAIAWGVGLSRERSDIAGAEGFHSLEGNMCGTAMRGAVALPGSKATSRAQGSYRTLGDLGYDRSGVAVAGPHRE